MFLLKLKREIIKTKTKKKNLPNTQRALQTNLGGMLDQTVHLRTPIHPIIR